MRTYYDVKLPFTGESLATFWFMLVIAYAVRRLPYALAAAKAALQQLHVSLEEAAENLGAGKLSVLSRIVRAADDRRPARRLCHELCDRGGRAVGDAAAGRRTQPMRRSPMRSIVYMQSAAGRGPGAALGVIAVVVVAIATYLAYRVAERERGLKSRELF